MDAIVVGAGPNGLAAAITLARAGRSVRILEAADCPGGGLRSQALTLPGFLHDVCSSVYPLGAASPFFRSLGEPERLWVHPPLCLAHPLDDGDACWIARSLDETVSNLRRDGLRYRRLFEPFVTRWTDLVDDVLAPPQVPRHVGVFARFGMVGVRLAASVARRFELSRTRALFAGLAAHSVLMLDAPLSAAVGVLLGVMAHAVGWPFAAGGAGCLADTLVSEFEALGGQIVVNDLVSTLDQLPPARTVLCDVTPRQFLQMAGDRLSPRYRRSLARYTYGPGVFKVDWALSGPIPWTAEACRIAGTVHVGGTLEEIAAAESAAWKGQDIGRPFVLVTQPTVCDPIRAPRGQHVAWGYCHVPHGSSMDMTAQIERQIERFAPGFRDVVLARHAEGPVDLARRNPNLVGGDIGGGAMTLRQVMARPTWRHYSTPLPGVFLCSSSTPPGGGVHGMCGVHAALAALGGR